MNEFVLQAKDLSFEYSDGTKALKNITLDIEKGKKIAFVGVNGSGKSTLFLNFNGVLRPTNGDISFMGERVKYNKASLFNLRKNVGIVFQDPENQLFSASVYQEVSFGVMNLKLDEDEVGNRVDYALESVGMYEFKDKAVHFLSYGQKKRVAIADIVAMKPEVIVLDEPTSSLDPKHSKKIIEILDELNKKGTTVILSTHDVNLAYSWADYIVAMKDGEIVKKGLPEEVFSDDYLIEECYLEKPIILEIFQTMCKNGYITDYNKIPKNKEELYRCFSKTTENEEI